MEGLDVVGWDGLIEVGRVRLWSLRKVSCVGCVSGVLLWNVICRLKVKLLEIDLAACENGDSGCETARGASSDWYARSVLYAWNGFCGCVCGGDVERVYDGWSLQSSTLFPRTGTETLESRKPGLDNIGLPKQFHNALLHYTLPGEPATFSALEKGLRTGQVFRGKLRFKPSQELTNLRRLRRCSRSADMRKQSSFRIRKQQRLFFWKSSKLQAHLRDMSCCKF